MCQERCQHWEGVAHGAFGVSFAGHSRFLGAFPPFPPLGVGDVSLEPPEQL